MFRKEYFIVDTDFDIISDLMKVDTAVKPPGIHEILDQTRHRFCPKWIKYMYAKFKNECPSGRMSLLEFKRLFGAYVPNRVSDAYLERMFHAFSYNNPDGDTITFSDLIECLSRLNDEDAQTKAEWTMRLMTRKHSDRIDYMEFCEFVGSIFQLVGREERRRLATSGQSSRHGSHRGSHVPVPDPSTANHVAYRSAVVFKELDTDGDGYLSEQDLVRFFQKYDQPSGQHMKQIMQ
uniref:EF-hand domain-containing protein n=1 Tax=Steinernema glaseri TaxID=37863 RepID=A0A1I7Z120_9BILA